MHTLAPTDPDNGNSTKERVVQIGTITNVKWNATEVHGTGWKAGWYKAEVYRYCEDTDILLHNHYAIF